MLPVRQPLTREEKRLRNQLQQQLRKQMQIVGDLPVLVPAQTVLALQGGQTQARACATGQNAPAIQACPSESQPLQQTRQLLGLQLSCSLKTLASKKQQQRR